MAAAEVEIIDVSLRDGIQNERSLLTLENKLEVIAMLIEAGVTKLQVSSFVHPTKVPQMADAEALIERLPRSEAIAFSALVLNEKGLERLKRTALRHVDLSLSCSDQHSRRNAGLSLAQATEQTLSMIASAKAADLNVRVGLQCAFGDGHSVAAPAAVVALGQTMLAAGCDALSLADSTGEATPRDVTRMVRAFQEFTDCPLILHLHDTRGLAMANLIAGYEAGVRRFDAALGGLGGCPFIASASGNLAIEDAVQYCAQMGLATGIDLTKLVAAGAKLERWLATPFPGKVYQLAQKSAAQVPAASPSPSRSGGELWA